MKLDDGKPWFRRWLWLAFRPINREGRIFLDLAMAVTFTPFLMAMMWGLTPVIEGLLYLAVLVCTAAHVVIYWKMDDGI